jgi:hypothetical protein
VNFPVIWVVARLLATAGPTARSAVAETLRPPTVVEATDKSDAFTASLDVAKHLSLLEEDGTGGDLSLGPTLGGRSRQAAPWFSDADQFRELCRKAFFARDLEDMERDDGPSDVAVGLAWLTSRDPQEPLAKLWSEGPNEELQQLKLLDHTANNDAQWIAFRRWTVDLGFATELGSRLHVDIEPAVASLVGQMKPGRMTANAFVKKVVKAVPVLDGGLIANYVEQTLGAPRGLGHATAGHLLHHTILRLEARKMVELHRGDDAQGTVAFASRAGPVTIDAVTVLEAPGVN